MEETSAQKPLSKEEILAEFANTTFDDCFADFFYDRYLDEFEVWEDYDNPNEMALKCVKHGLTWYALYKQIGHDEQWCKAAYEFGCEAIEIDVSLENEIECMAEVTERVECYSKDLSDLAAIQKVYGNIDEVKQRWAHDLTELDMQLEYDDVCYETGQVIQEVLELTQQADIKFGIYKVALNRWNKITHWSPAQLCYYFLDADGGRWCIYLRWDGEKGDEPWSAELVRCDKNWVLRFDHPDTVNLLKENEHVPGTVVGYYLDREYPLLQVKALELVKKRFPDLDFPNVQ